MKCQFPDPLGQTGVIDSPSSTAEEGANGGLVNGLVTDSCVRQEILSIPPFTSQLPLWNTNRHVCEMLQYYSERVSKGKCQSTLPVLSPAGIQIEPHIASDILLNPNNEFHISFSAVFEVLNSYRP